LRDVVRLTASDNKPPAGAPIRKLDRGWHDLRITLMPLQAQRVVVWNPQNRTGDRSLLRGLHWARAERFGAARSAEVEVALNAVDMSTTRMNRSSRCWIP
jgi:hypothetical protein